MPQSRTAAAKRSGLRAIRRSLFVFSGADFWSSPISSTSSAQAQTAVGLGVRGRLPKFSNDFLDGRRDPTNSPSIAQAVRPALEESHSIARRSIPYRQPYL